MYDSQERGVSTLSRRKLINAPADMMEAKNWLQVLEFTNDMAAVTPPCESPWGDAVSVVIYGPSGVGKTSFASCWPANTVVFDSLTGIEKFCFQHHCKEEYDDDWSKTGFYSFMQGPKSAAKNVWTVWLDDLNALRAAGWNVVLLAHSAPQPKTFHNPDGQDYDRWYVYLDKETWSQTHRWAEATLFYNYNVVTKKDGMKSKATDVEERFLYTQWQPTFDAKNQLGLPPIIEAGHDHEECYQSFLEQMTA